MTAFMDIRPHSNVPPMGERTPMLHKPELLIVDIPREVKTLCALLGREGYQTVGVSSAEAALDAIRASKYPLLLTDLHMPQLDAIELIRAAQAYDPEIVCIVMTDDGTVQNAFQTAGALDFILKPFQVGNIRPVLSRALYVHRLRAENSLLQRRVAEYAAKFEGNDMALRAASELGPLAHSVRQDLRAPPRAIRAVPQTLAEDLSSPVPTKAQRVLRSICASATQMNHLVDDLLRAVDADGHAIPRAQVELAALVQEVLTELGGADQRVTIRIGEFPQVYADAALLKQLFAILLSNAIKHTADTAEAVIEVGSYKVQDSCTVFVRDNGAGFDMKQAERIFRASRRAHGHAKHEVAGVDLSFVKQIVERHGGRIWVKGGSGQGVTFYFTLSAGASWNVCK